MIDENGTDSEHRPESRLTPIDSLTRYVPGAAANAPKRNVLVTLVYLFACALTVGLLWAAL
ncbi:hypothetical protein U4E84_02225 [Halorubrum sp. AD140]|uniref:hypothetical protein n=1 Tax=Halorubrum sp. AD140 TaxID=3050073 RepID=UPI002ACCA852|nr:hypothetical protein [Halorubrum sp. AD140]MDZ5810171.1 hypothetical protein [Halorubrum sp. AD140]